MNAKLTATSLLALLGLAAMSPAPINGFSKGITPRAGLRVDTEQSLEQQQALQKTQGAIGGDPSSQKDPTAGVIQTDGQGKDTLLAAPGTSSPAASALGRQVLIDASEKKPAQADSKWWLLGLGVFLVAAFGAFQKWAKSSVPPMPKNSGGVASGRSNW